LIGRRRDAVAGTARRAREVVAGFDAHARTETTIDTVNSRRPDEKDRSVYRLLDVDETTTDR
jgi:hypothetical protein